MAKKEKLSDKDVELLAEVFSDPKKWAEAVLPSPENPRLPFRSNWIQDFLLAKEAPKYSAITAQRQTGKSCGVSARLLWLAFTQDSRKILVIAPTNSAVDNVFRILRHYIEHSTLRNSIVSNTRNPNYIELSNGSYIAGFCTGVASKSHGIQIRGQAAHFIYVDEADFLDDGDWAAIVPLWNALPGDREEPVGAWLTSTVSGLRTRFYMIRENVDHQGEGWASWSFPCKDVPGCTAYNPRWTEEIDEQKRYSMTELEYVHEYLCQLGDFEKGIIRNEYITLALEKGREDNLVSHPSINYNAIRAMGVDWDKYGASPNICVLEINPVDNLHYQVIYREETEKSQYTLDFAVKRVLELNKVFHPAYIYVDRGYGELQYEQLRMAGLNHVKGIVYNGNTEFYDARTQSMGKVPTKHAMVNIMQWMFEKGLVKLPTNDPILIKQLQLYRVEKITPTGIPVYSTKDDHAVCAFMMALFALVENFNNPYVTRREYGDPKLFKVNYYKNFPPIGEGRTTEKPVDFDEQFRVVRRAGLLSGFLYGTFSTQIEPRSKISSSPPTRTTKF